MSEPACPFCRARLVERVGEWGGQIITAQWRCRRCGSFFEALRSDFDDARPPVQQSGKPSTNDRLR